MAGFVVLHVGEKLLPKLHELEGDLAEDGEVDDVEVGTRIHEGGDFAEGFLGR